MIIGDSLNNAYKMFFTKGGKGNFHVSTTSDDEWLVLLNNNQFLVTAMYSIFTLSLCVLAYVIYPDILNFQEVPVLGLISYCVFYLFLFLSIIFIFYSLLELVVDLFPKGENDTSVRLYHSIVGEMIYKRRKLAFLKYYGVTDVRLKSIEQRKAALDFINMVVELEFQLNKGNVGGINSIKNVAIFFRNNIDGADSKLLSAFLEQSVSYVLNVIPIQRDINSSSFGSIVLTNSELLKS